MQEGRIALVHFPEIFIGSFVFGNPRKGYKPRPVINVESYY